MTGARSVTIIGVVRRKDVISFQKGSFMGCNVIPGGIPAQQLQRKSLSKRKNVLPGIILRSVRYNFRSVRYVFEMDAVAHFE
jgi:hypothetical protein